MRIKQSAAGFSALYHAAETIEYSGIRLPRDLQKKRLAAVIANELTDLQKETLQAYMDGATVRQIAADRGVNPGTVSRTLRRAITRTARFLRY